MNTAAQENGLYEVDVSPKEAREQSNADTALISYMRHMHLNLLQMPNKIVTVT
jgi:hypothetical protein